MSVSLKDANSKNIVHIVGDVKDSIEESLGLLEEDVLKLQKAVPNMASDDVPVGATEDGSRMMGGRMPEVTKQTGMAKTLFQCRLGATSHRRHRQVFLSTCGVLLSVFCFRCTRHGTPCRCQASVQALVLKSKTMVPKGQVGRSSRA